VQRNSGDAERIAAHARRAARIARITRSDLRRSARLLHAIAKNQQRI
jgi:hypothetical protein